MAKENSKRYMGVFGIKGKKGLSYGIDYVHPETGQRVRKILKSVTTEAKAAEIRAVEITDAARGAINKAYGFKAKAKAVSFCDMVDTYLAWSRENKKSWMTDEHNAKPLKNALKTKLMSDINPFLIEQYKVQRARVVHKRTVNNELALGSQVYEKAFEWRKWQGSNPFRKLRFKVDKGKKPGCLSLSQVEAIIAEISHPVKRDMVAFAFYQGWRISEIRKLKWEHVDLEKGRAWLVDPKNGESAEIPLSNEARAIISKQNRRGQHVFCKLNGEAWVTNMNQVIKSAAQGAGVELPPRKAWHIFRRTWASTFLQNGGDVESLRVQGHWKDYAMPMWYADPANEEHRKEILNRFPKLTDGRNLAEKGKLIQLSASNGETIFRGRTIFRV